MANQETSVSDNLKTVASTILTEERQNKSIRQKDIKIELEEELIIDLLNNEKLGNSQNLIKDEKTKSSSQNERHFDFSQLEKHNHLNGNPIQLTSQNIQYPEQDQLQVIFIEDFNQNQDLLLQTNLSDEEEDQSNTEFKCNAQSKESVDQKTGSQYNMMQSIQNYNGSMPGQTIIGEGSTDVAKSEIWKTKTIIDKTDKFKDTSAQSFNYQQQITSNNSQMLELTTNLMSPNNGCRDNQSILHSPRSIITSLKLNQIQSKKNFGDQGDLISIDDIESQVTSKSNQMTKLNSKATSKPSLHQRLQIENYQQVNYEIALQNSQLQQTQSNDQTQLLSNQIEKDISIHNKLNQSIPDQNSEILQECSLNHPYHANKNKQKAIPHKHQAQNTFQNQTIENQNNSLIDFQNLERKQLKEEYRKLKRQLQEITLKNREQKYKESMKNKKILNDRDRESSCKSQIKKNLQNFNQVQIHKFSSNSCQKNIQGDSSRNGVRNQSRETSKEISTIESLYRFKDDQSRIKQIQQQQFRSQQFQSGKYQMKTQDLRQSSQKENNIFSNLQKICIKNRQSTNQDIRSSRNKEQIYATHGNHFQKGKLSTMDYPVMHKLIQNQKTGNTKRQPESIQSLSARSSIANLRADRLIKNLKHQERNFDASQTSKKFNKKYQIENNNKKLKNVQNRRNKDIEYYSSDLKENSQNFRAYKNTNKFYNRKSNCSSNQKYHISYQKRSSSTPQENIKRNYICKKHSQNQDIQGHSERRRNLNDQSPQIQFRYSASRNQEFQRSEISNQSKQQLSSDKINVSVKSKSSHHKCNHSKNQQNIQKPREFTVQDNQYKNHQLGQSLDRVQQNKINFNSSQQDSQRHRSNSVQTNDLLAQSLAIKIKQTRDTSSNISSQKTDGSSLVMIDIRNKIGDQKNISPSKLNKELNKILQTEKMIKEYKEMITKMQRDFYSKKSIIEGNQEDQTTARRNQFEDDRPSTIKEKLLNMQRERSLSKSQTKKTPNSLVNYKRIFKEDINPKQALQPLLKYAESDSLRINQFQILENAIQDIRIKIDSNFIPQKIQSKQQTTNEYMNSPAIIYRESLISQISAINQDPNLRSDSKISRISISPKLKSQRFTPNKQFNNQRNHSNSLHQGSTIFTSFPNNSQQLNNLNNNMKQNKVNNNINLIFKDRQGQQNSRLQSQDGIPYCIYDKTVIPEDEQEQVTQYLPYSGKQGLYEEESIINNQQQQQEILNFYREFQQEDDTIPTPVSMISKQPSYIAFNQSPMLIQNQSRRFEQNQQNLSSHHQNSSQFQLGSKKPQIPNQDVKIVSIQINGNKRSSEETASKFHEIMRITSEMIEKRKQQDTLINIRQREITPPKNQQFQFKMNKASFNQNTEMQRISDQKSNFLKTSFNNTLKVVPSTLATQNDKLQLDQARQNSNSQQKYSQSNYSTINSSRQSSNAYQSVVSQILYKKSAQKANKNSNLVKFMEDSQKRQQRHSNLRGVSINLSTKFNTLSPTVQNMKEVDFDENYEQKFNGQNQAFQENMIINPKNNQKQLISQVEDEYMTFNSERDPHQLPSKQQFNQTFNPPCINYGNSNNASQSQGTNSLRSSMQIKTQSIDLSGNAAKMSSASRRSSWVVKENSQSKRPPQNIDSKAYEIDVVGLTQRNTQTRNSVQQYSFQPLVGQNNKLSTYQTLNESKQNLNSSNHNKSQTNSTTFGINLKNNNRKLLPPSSSSSSYNTALYNRGQLNQKSMKQNNRNSQMITVQTAVVPVTTLNLQM